MCYTTVMWSLCSLSKLCKAICSSKSPLALHIRPRNDHPFMNPFDGNPSRPHLPGSAISTDSIASDAGTALPAPTTPSSEPTSATQTSLDTVSDSASALALAPAPAPAPSPAPTPASSSIPTGLPATDTSSGAISGSNFTVGNNNTPSSTTLDSGSLRILSTSIASSIKRSTTASELYDMSSVPSPSTSISISPVSPISRPPSHDTVAAQGRSNHIGPIVGGVLAGMVIIIALVLLLCGRRFARRWRGKHRIAPSAEFMGRTDAPFSPPPRPSSGLHMRSLSAYGSISGSRNASPFGASISGYGMYQDDNARGMVGGVHSVGAFVYGSEESAGGSRDEPPPPFTAGNFNDPLFEKLSDAARQHELLYRTVITPLPRSPVPHIIDSHNTTASPASALQHPSPALMTGSSQLRNPHLDTYTSESEETEEDLKPTSPILHRMSMSSHAGARNSMTGDIGWAV